MPFVTVNLADRGTPYLVNPKTGLPGVSATGHMWVTLVQGPTHRNFPKDLPQT